MSTGYKDYAGRVMALAVKIGGIPTTGTIEVERAHALMAEAFGILDIAFKASEAAHAESAKHVEIGVELAGRCNSLYDQLIELRTERVWNKPGATA